MPQTSPEYRALSEVLLEARTAAGLTQRDLAARLDRQHSFIGKIESGSRHINVIEFIEVAGALGIDPERLFAKVVNSTKQLLPKKAARSRS